MRKNNPVGSNRRPAFSSFDKLRYANGSVYIDIPTGTETYSETVKAFRMALGILQMRPGDLLQVDVNKANELIEPSPFRDLQTSFTSAALRYIQVFKITQI